ncbi:unnamed protein product [Closterium sp. NIES-53]
MVSRASTTPKWTLDYNTPSPLLPFVASAAAADLGGFESVGAATAPSGSRRNGRSKGDRGARWGGGGGGGGGGGSGGGGGGGGGGGIGGGSAGFVATNLTSGGVTSGRARGHVSCIHVPGGSGGGQRQQQQRSRETPSPQQLREWYAGRQRGGGAGPCTYVLCTGDRAGEQCGGLHSNQRCFGRLTDAWRHQFPDATEILRWGDLSRAGIAVFDLDYDAILAAMYALSTSDEGDCYLCVPPDPGIEAVALGAGETAALGASAYAAPGAVESAPSVPRQLRSSTPSPLTRVLPAPSFETAPHLRRSVGRLQSPWRTPLEVLSLLVSPLSYRARQPPLALCQVSTFPRSLQTW